MTTPSDQPGTPAAAAAKLSSDLRALLAFSRELQEMDNDMRGMQESFGLLERGHYTSTEHDQIESLLFRYLACRESLWDLVAYYATFNERFQDPRRQSKAFVLAFSAALHLSYYGSTLVTVFLDEPMVIAKLNEAYHRYGIPEGTYDKVFASITSIDNIAALHDAWELFQAEISNPDSELAHLRISDQEYRQLIAQMDEFFTQSQRQTEQILEERSLMLPGVRNRLRHTSIATRVASLRKMFRNNLYAVRSVLFENVSRLKSPTSSFLSFSEEQIAELKSQLQPGDIIITFTAGYMSNVFLPGLFKHGLTYVGSPAQRNAAGLNKTYRPQLPKARIQEFQQNLEVQTLPSGLDADVIEAVAEGVIFNSIEHLAHTHINRMLVLRPKLNAEQRIQQLETVFSLLGSGYDFKFDFNDATFQCCTEVIYRALHGRGDVKFTLTDRMGRQTLSADDILDYHLEAETSPFSFVLLVTQDTEKKGVQAKLLLGDEGEKSFLTLMSEFKK